MDMRFGDWSEARSAAPAALPIDYRCFVAALAAAQASTPTARAAAHRRTLSTEGWTQVVGTGSFHPETAARLTETPRQPR